MTKQSKITASNEKPLKAEEPLHINDDIEHLCSDKLLTNPEQDSPKSPNTQKRKTFHPKNKDGEL